MEALCESGLIDRCYQPLDVCPWARAYVEDILIARRTSSFPTLHCIRTVAERLLADKNMFSESSYQNYVLRLLRLAGSAGHQGLRSLLLKSQGAYELRKFDHDLLAAAIYMKHNDFAEHLAKRNIRAEMGTRTFGHMYNRVTTSAKMGTFGHPFKAAVVTEDYTVWALLASVSLGRPYKLEEGADLLGMVTEMATPAMFRYISDPRISTKPPLNPSSILAQPSRTPLYETIRTRSRPLGILTLVLTPNVEIFHMILEQLRAAQIDVLNESETFLDTLLFCAATYGRAEMTRHLLELGARVNREQGRRQALTSACEYGNDEIVSILLEHNAEVNGEELKAAVSRGRSSTVRILLERGVDIPLESKIAEGCLYAAAKKGFRDIVQMLLDAGADPNAETPSPLVGAIATENSGMFQLLVERGAAITPILPQLEEVAMSAGLESMQALLHEYKAKG